MDLSFGYIDNAHMLGDYCRRCIDDTTELTRDPETANNIWEIYKCLRITDELIRIFAKLEIFDKLANAGYKLRETPHIIRWNYNGDNHGAADHYHHDGHFGMGGQISLMLLLDNNIGKTHMRLVPNSRNLFGRKIYDFLWKYPFRGRGRLFKINDWLIERMHSIVRLEGPRDRLYFFNAGDNLHKAYPVLNTTRTIFHLNLTLYDSKLSNVDHEDIDHNNINDQWKMLLNIS